MGSNIWLDALCVLLVVIGASMSLTAGIGLLRFNDVMSRLHAQSKPQSAGLLLLLIALGLQQGKLELLSLLLVVVIFQVLTTSAAALLLTRAGYRSSHYDETELVVDDLHADVERAARAAELEARRESKKGDL